MKSSRKLLPAAAGLVLAALVAPAFADGGGSGGHMRQSAGLGSVAISN